MTASHILPPAVATILDALDAHPERSPKAIYRGTRAGVHVLTRDQQVVILMGLQHIASLPASHRMMRALDAADDAGFLLYTEGITPRATAVREYTDQQKAELSATLDALSATNLGTHMHVIRPFGQRMHVADISYETLIERFPQAAHEATPLNVQMAKFRETAISDKNRARVLRSALRLSAYVPQFRRDSRALLTLRDKLFAEFIAGQSQNVIAVWGALHGPGMTKNLTRMGFTHVGSWSHQMGDYEATNERVTIPAGVSVRPGHPSFTFLA